MEDHVERLEELASVLIETGIRDGEDSARLYGQRLKSGVRALTSVSVSAPSLPPHLLDSRFFNASLSQCSPSNCPHHHMRPLSRNTISEYGGYELPDHVCCSSFVNENKLLP